MTFFYIETVKLMEQSYIIFGDAVEGLEHFLTVVNTQKIFLVRWKNKKGFLHTLRSM